MNFVELAKGDTGIGFGRDEIGLNRYGLPKGIQALLEATGADERDSEFVDGLMIVGVLPDEFLPDARRPVVILGFFELRSSAPNAVDGLSQGFNRLCAVTHVQRRSPCELMPAEE